MSGTALADWSLSEDPRHVTNQVASLFYCKNPDRIAACLREKDLMNVPVSSASYTTGLGPTIDGLVRNDPRITKTKFKDAFSR